MVNSYQGSVINEQGGDRRVVKSGGSIDVESGGSIVVESGAAIDVESGGEIDIESGGSIDVESGGAIDILASGLFELAGSDMRAELALVAGLNTELVALAGLGAELDALVSILTPVAGVAAGYMIARGVETPDAGQVTVVTGLATVVAVVASLEANPTLTHFSAAAEIGNQSGAPAAGSIYINSSKPTATGDVTPVAATTPWGAVGWIAVGV